MKNQTISAGNPGTIEAWENRRFSFNPDHQLLLKTKLQPQGVEWIAAVFSVYGTCLRLTTPTGLHCLPSSCFLALDL